MKPRGLLIRNVTEADNGDYTCRAEVETAGRYGERKISLVVHSAYTLFYSVNATSTLLFASPQYYRRCQEGYTGPRWPDPQSLLPSQR